MLKTIVLALSFVGFLSVGSAVAEDKMDKMGSMKCTDADMPTMETKMKGMMDTDKQKMAMGEMDMMSSPYHTGRISARRSHYLVRTLAEVHMLC